MHAVGSLIKARRREWVVLPGSTDEYLLVRPLDGAPGEETAVLPAIEQVEAASFSPPDPEQIGDHNSCRLLREALRLGFRASAGPFRSMADIVVEPRPYQLVPMLMALRQPKIRLLIADDVGIGKTVEALLIAKEMLARGEISRIAVLCPPHLAEQWQTEMLLKFNLRAELVLPSTATRLEKICGVNESLFDHYPIVIVSLDFIKSERRRHEFLQACPEFVIVDEAHTCTQSGASAQQRFQLLKHLSDSERHLVLVTATPHSGNDEAFGSMISLLDPAFAHLPDDLSGDANRKHREHLARHFVQRRRGDILAYLNENTSFPTRVESEHAFTLSTPYRQLLDKVLNFARDVVKDESGTKAQRQVRWWSVLSMLRCISSSPAAAVSTFNNRAAALDAESQGEIDEIGKRSVFDLSEEDTAEAFDAAPGSDFEPGTDRVGKRLRAFAKEAEALMGASDNKLQEAVPIVKKLLDDGFNPIVFCRFVATADYVADHLKRTLKGVEVACVTGALTPAEREDAVIALANHDGKRVLVCTDCLSEGVNLQHYHDAVIHYDLSWNPTRHEQREGRVDRFFQKSPKVRVLTYFGKDNPVDGIVLNVLIKKHKKIRDRLGISVPVPSKSDNVLGAVMEALLFKGDPTQYVLFDELAGEQQRALEAEWEEAAAREDKARRSIFAQQTIDVEDVGRELAEIRRALGAWEDVEWFVRHAVPAVGGRISDGKVAQIDLTESRRSVRRSLETPEKFRATFHDAAGGKVEHVTRAHTLVDHLASYLLGTALDPEVKESPAARCGAMPTRAVDVRTTLVLVRYRFMLDRIQGTLLGEDWEVLGFRGAPTSPEWLDSQEVEKLLAAVPAGNKTPSQQTEFVRRVTDNLSALLPAVREAGERRAAQLLDSHNRVRKAAGTATAARTVKMQGDPDVLGVYVLLPGGGDA